MASYFLNNCKLYFDGLDISGQTNQGTLKLTKDAKDQTTFGSGGFKQYLAGVTEGVLNVQAFYQATPNGIDPYVDTRYGTSGVPITVAPTTGAVGEVAYSFTSLALNIERDFQFNEIPQMKVQSYTQSMAARCTVLEDGSTARVSTGFGNGIQLGAVSSSQSVYAALHVLGVTGGTPSITVTVQSDSTNAFSSPITVATFSAANAIGGQWITPVTGANADTWWRIGWTISGSSPSFNIVSTVGIN